MFALLDRLISGSEKQLKQSDLDKMTRRQPFSAYLNYLAYDYNLDIYLNQDCSLGMLWECVPLSFAGSKTINSLEGLFRAGLPKGSVVQLILHADSHIKPILGAYKKSRKLTDAIVVNNTEKVCEFMDQGRGGLENCSNIPVRNFRLFVAAKIPGDAPEIPSPGEFAEKGKVTSLQDIKRQIYETLKAARLSPVSMTPDRLLEWMRRFINQYPEGYPDRNFGEYNDNIPLRKQIINADTVIKEKGDTFQVGRNYFCAITPKTVPAHVDPLQTNALFGGMWGMISDQDQIKTSFLYALNIIFEKGLETRIHASCNMLLNQKAVGSLSPILRRKQEEFLEAADSLEHGIKFARVMPVLLVWHHDQETARESCTRARRLWEGQGYVMQQETLILKMMFLNALPFCLYTNGRNVETLERDYIASVPSITPLLPVQGDFTGSGGTPKTMFIGRKGQLITLDLFAKGANNHNCWCAATTGSGKSFFVNYLAYNYHACGALIRIIDIGGSYKKMSMMLGAKYLDFHPDTTICLNPFTHIQDPDEELKTVTAVFAQMAYSNSDTDKCDDTEMNLVRNAVRWAWEQKGQDADSDLVYEFLSKFPNVPNSNFGSMGDNQNLVEVSRKMAFNIREFTSFGFHGKFFVGPSSFDIQNDSFVVLELEHLKRQMDLYRVVTLLVINAVTQDLYLSDRSRQRLVIFDEAWQFLGKAAMLASVIEEGYRRARKYNGSFTVITQSILDIEKFGDVGKVIDGNSAFKVFLESSDFDKALKAGLIDYDGFTSELLKSLKSNRPRYSEIFLDTPFGVGVARLVVDPYAYFIYTSDATEISMIERMISEKGVTYHQAITEMVRLREKGEL